MDAHSDICGPTTKHVFNPVARNLFRYEPIGKTENWEELLEDINTLLNVDFSVWESSFTVEKLSALAPKGDIKALLKHIFYEEAQKNNKDHVFVKENQVYEFLPFLLLYFPHSKYVYQVRDPRDMALSWKKSSPHPGGVIKGARQWQKDQQNTLKNYNQLRKQQKAILVRYEDLITDPENEVSRILQFLGFSYEPEMMSFYEDKLTRQNAGKIDAWKNLSRGIISDNKKKYKKELSSQEIKYIEKICVHEMIYLGYEPENRLESLEQIAEKDVADFEKQENAISCERSEGIKANMLAKKRMYTKIL